MRPAPLGLCQQRVTCGAGVEAITVIDVLGIKPDIIDIGVPGIRQPAGLTVLVQHTAQDRVIVITNDGVELFPALAVATIARIYRVRVQPGNTAEAFIKTVHAVTAVIAGRPDRLMMRLAYSTVRRFSFADRVADIELIPRHGEIQCAKHHTLNDQHIAQVKHTVRLRDI